MKAKPILVAIIIISFIVVYGFFATHVFIGLWEATAIQGFSGFFILLLAFMAVIVACFDVHNWFD